MSLLSLDGMVTESVPCARLLPCEVRPGDVFRWSGRFASDPFTTQCVTVVEVSAEYIEVISLSASLDGVS